MQCCLYNTNRKIFFCGTVTRKNDCILPLVVHLMLFCVYKMKGLLVAHSRSITQYICRDRATLSLIWAAPHYLAVAPWQCEMCPTECFVSLPSGAWSHLSLLPSARHASAQTRLPIQQSKAKESKDPASTNVFFYTLSHSISRGSLCTQPPIIQRSWASSESMARHWLNLPTTHHPVLTVWRDFHNS